MVLNFFNHFITYNGFRYNEGKRPLQNFYDLVKKMKWVRNSAAFKQRKQEFEEEILQQVEAQFDDNKVDSYIRLIELYGLLNDNEIMPTSITKCKVILQTSLFANIYDFIAGDYQNFGNLAALRRYTNRTRQYFSLEEAKDSIIQKALLRKLF